MSARAGQPEVLAPAGSPAALDAALLCGADAVYFGVDVLNARRNAENFTLEHLADTVRRCHVRGVKVYLTLNIVVLEQEIPQLMRAAEAACAAGVDAVIVQDAGEAAILRSCAPKMPLHASTQMVVHNAEGARRLESMGFSRVVAARECTREELAAIAAGTSMQVEAFVHGALCMSVSGQCYLSSVLGRRSGNRGLCAQPCRLAFTAGGCGHALSLKDMSLIERVRELQKTGVCSLKIEGRMKRPEYVAAAVTACRAALAGETPDMESLRAVFSRSGFTDSYFDGRVDSSLFGYRQKEDVTAAAGVLGKLENLYADPRRQVQKVGVEMAFAMKAGAPAFLSVLDCDGNCVCAEGDIPQAAVSRPTDPDRARVALCKTGGTPYHVERTLCSISPGLMLPASSINALRRDALAKLDEQRGAPRPVQFDAAALWTPPDSPRAPRPTLHVRLYDPKQLSEEMMEEAALVTLPVQALLDLLERDEPPCPDKLCAGLPRILFDGQDRLRAQLERLRGYGVKHAAVGNPGAAQIAADYGFLMHGEPFLNATNSYAAEALAGWGLCDLALSFELSLDAARALRSPVPRGVTVYGRLPLMTMRACPVKAFVGCARCRQGENFITDRRGESFYTSCAYGCAELLNPMPLFMADRLDELGGFDFVELRFTTETPADCARILRAYRYGGRCDGPFTRGLLYKTVL
ncbi:U32 family peptidase [Anaerotruncus colihominis]|uniref:U32 family peptidase n=1 Tax=Anaerotruncus colihominis TaxID=169435 RepID=UPI00174D3F91|nr:U32 family peptidase [Anaerotruncus colihominis]